MKFYEVLAMLDKDPALAMYRTGWNGVKVGKSMRVMVQIPDSHSKMTKEYLYLEVAQDGVVKRIPWLISQEDVFADDWVAQY